MKIILLILAVLFTACKERNVVNNDTNDFPILKIVKTEHQSIENSDVDWRNVPRIKCASFANDTNLWIVTAKEGKVLVLDDDGENWRTFWEGNAACIDFLDQNNGWIVDNANRIWQTSDSGKTWNERVVNVTLSSVIKIKFMDLSNGWILDAFNLFFTKDGGRTWEASLSYRNKPLYGQPGDLYSLNSQIVWSCDSKGWVYGTENQGEKWFAKRVIKTNSSLCDIFFINQDVGWYSSGIQQFFSTVDRGRTWNKITSLPEDFEVRSTFWFDAEEGWLAGFFHSKTDQSPRFGVGSLLHTINGGKTWTSFEIEGKNPFFEEIHFFNTESGWLISRDSIYVTRNGGKNWYLSLNLPPIQEIQNSNK